MNTSIKRAKSVALRKKCNLGRGPTKHQKEPFHQKGSP